MATRLGPLCRLFLLASFLLGPALAGAWTPELGVGASAVAAPSGSEHEEGHDCPGDSCPGEEGERGESDDDLASVLSERPELRAPLAGPLSHSRGEGPPSPHLPVPTAPPNPAS